MKKYVLKVITKLYGLQLSILILLSEEKAARSAFNIFCKVHKGRVLPHQKEFLEAAKLEKETVEDHAVQLYRWAGTGATVLLIHGWESNTWRWRKLIAELQKNNYNIIAFDAPGHGYSSGKYLHVPLYASVTEFIVNKYKPTSIVGHSVGGMTSLYHEYTYKNTHIERIVTLGAPSEFSEILLNFQNLLGFNHRVTKALSNYIKNRFGFSPEAFSTANFVKENLKKGILFHDRFDNITPYHASENVHKHWKDSRFITTEGLGHSMHQEEVNNKIIDFLKS